MAFFFFFDDVLVECLLDLYIFSRLLMMVMMVELYQVSRQAATTVVHLQLQTKMEMATEVVLA